MKPFLQIGTLDPGHHGPAGERFMVLSIDPTRRRDGGCVATVQSLHHSEEEAQAAIDQEQP